MQHYRGGGGFDCDCGGGFIGTFSLSSSSLSSLEVFVGIGGPPGARAGGGLAQSRYVRKQSQTVWEQSQTVWEGSQTVWEESQTVWEESQAREQEEA